MKSSVVFKATDLDIIYRKQSNAVVYSPGAIALPGKKLLEIVSKFPEDLSFFSRSIKKLKKHQFNADKTKISLSGMMAEDFPVMGESEKVVLFVPADLLRTAIAQTSFAAASFDTGSVIGGVLHVN